MTKGQQDHLRKHLYAFTVGSAGMVSKKHAVEAINVFSEEDHLAAIFAKPYLSDNRYNIQCIPCITPEKERISFVGDHAFLGRTYQKALNNQIGILKNNYGFYDAKTR